MNKCVRCNGVFLHGEPPHVMNYNGKDTLWCRDCIEEYSAMAWNDVEWGPYPFTVQPRARPARSDA